MTFVTPIAPSVIPPHFVSLMAIGAPADPLATGKLKLDSTWLLWFLVLLGGVLVVVAFLQWRRSNKLHSPTAEPGVEKLEHELAANITGNETGATLEQTASSPGEDQQVKEHTGAGKSIKGWLQRVLDFIKRSPSTQMALELLFILIAVFSFCQGFLDLNSSQVLPGNEAEMFQALDWVFYQSVVQDHQFPIWNSYMRTGQPNIADPMFHSFNPLVGLPTLLWGVQDGFKIAVFLSILVAALGMHRLGVALGLNRAVRVWMALMFAFAGQPLAHVLQGQYLFIFGFAWIPWTIWGLYQLRRTRRMVYMAFSALAIALVIFSGNSYYAFYLAIVVALFADCCRAEFPASEAFFQDRLETTGFVWTCCCTDPGPGGNSPATDDRVLLTHEQGNRDLRLTDSLAGDQGLHLQGYLSI